MSWGSSQNTQQSGTTQSQQTGSNSNTTTPNLPPWLQSAFQQNVTGGQNLVAQAQQPVFGQAQTAQFLQQQNQQAQASQNNLMSQLASKGITNSGAATQGLTDIQLGKNANESQFFSQLPFEQQQASLANQEGALGASNNINKSVPYGSTSTGQSSGQSSGSSSSNSETQSNPGLAGLISSLGGMALGGVTGGMGGLGGATGGSKAGAPSVPGVATSAIPNSGYLNANTWGQQPAPSTGSTFGMNPNVFDSF